MCIIETCLHRIVFTQGMHEHERVVKLSSDKQRIYFLELHAIGEGMLTFSGLCKVARGVDDGKAKPSNDDKYQKVETLNLEILPVDFVGILLRFLPAIVATSFLFADVVFVRSRCWRIVACIISRFFQSI